ncbi:MAG: hypothetical protein LBV69_11190 [Bacteroidales bacterium]|jgi:hypothetical protein|nr:hypothetical protein [Bacteroidales bacterium]
MENNITKFQKELINQLNSKNDLQILSTIDLLREEGGDFIILPLMEKYFNTSSQEIKDKIGNLFTDIKKSSAGTIISDNILKYENTNNLDIFLRLLWESTIKFSNLSPFIEFLFSENLKISIESSTIIEEQIKNTAEEDKKNYLKIIEKRKHKIEDVFHKNLIELTEELIRNSI